MVVPFQPVQRRRIHEAVAEQLRDAILDGRFAAGQRLPAERELAEEFGVNRTSIREAIKVLEGLGLVLVRQGNGATVQPLTDASFDVLPPMIFHSGRIDTALLGELAEVMMPLLLEMARLALERYRPEHFAALTRLCTEISDESREAEARFASARDILVLLSDMAGNRVWQMLARRTRNLLASPPMQEARQRLRRDPSRIAALVRTCVSAVEAGQPDAALASLRSFITAVGDEALRVNPGAQPRVAREAALRTRAG